jgi:hypothetical protein
MCTDGTDSTGRPWPETCSTTAPDGQHRRPSRIRAPADIPTEVYLWGVHERFVWVLRRWLLILVLLIVVIGLAAALLGHDSNNAYP